MKFSILPIAATATLFSPALAADDALSLSKLKLDPLAFALAEHNLDFLSPGHSLVLNNVSAQCKAEVATLTQNSDLQAAIEALGQTCPGDLGTSPSHSEITQDFGPCDKGQVQLACTAAGGKRCWHVSHLCCIPLVRRICTD